jgi:hypothetical protein
LFSACLVHHHASWVSRHTDRRSTAPSVTGTYLNGLNDCLPLIAASELNFYDAILGLDVFKD